MKKKYCIKMTYNYSSTKPEITSIELNGIVSNNFTKLIDAETDLLKRLTIDEGYQLTRVCEEFVNKKYNKKNANIFIKAYSPKKNLTYEIIETY